MNRNCPISLETVYMEVMPINLISLFLPSPQFQNTGNGREDLKLELAIKALPKLGLGDILGKGTIGPLMFIAPTAKNTIKAP